MVLRLALSVRRLVLAVQRLVLRVGLAATALMPAVLGLVLV
jgi:hypothetical protein